MALSAPSWSPVGRTVSFLRGVVRTFREAHVPFVAGSIAYSAFVSLVPLLVLALLAASALGGEAFAGAVLRATGTYLSPTGRTLVLDALRRATGRAGLSLFSLLVLGWAVLRLLRGLDLAFSLLYDTDDGADFIDRVVDGLVVMVAIPVGAAGMAATFVVFSLLPTVPYPRVVEKALAVAFLSVVLLPVYYVFPDVPLSAREVLPGTVVAAVGWTALASGFQLYVALVDGTQVYGVLGAVVLLVTLLYFGSLVLLLGVTVNVVIWDGPRSGATATA